VCSLKPTHRRISVDGVLPLAPSLDHIGIMANCVRDLAIVFEAVGGPPGLQGWHSATSAVPASIQRIDNCSNTIPHMDRLCALFDERCGGDIRALYKQAMEQLDDGLFDMESVVPTASFAELHAAHLVVMSVEAAAYHEDRFLRSPEDYPAQITKLIEDGLRTPATVLSRAFELQRELTEQVDQMMAYDRLLVTSATTSLPPGIESTGDPSFNSPWSFLGLPTVSIPAAWSGDGLPYAVQITGRQTYEDDLFAAAAWVEKLFALDRRLPPVPG
jgi:Asp-tRNA(Asn)/Glu-tRNA(Gln) amidotransferase A subunit family amidase